MPTRNHTKRAPVRKPQTVEEKLHETQELDWLASQMLAEAAVLLDEAERTFVRLALRDADREYWSRAA
jgi:hypothetical protein